MLIEKIKKCCEYQVERTNKSNAEDKEISYELGARNMALLILSEINASDKC